MIKFIKNYFKNKNLCKEKCCVGGYTSKSGSGSICANGSCVSGYDADRQYPTKKSGRIKGCYKVPFRDVHCNTFKSWLAEVILCHIVYRLDPPNLPDLDNK